MISIRNKGILVFTLVMVLSLIFSSVAAARDPFVGAWKSTDTYDGSYQTLTIGRGPGSIYHVRYYDFGASNCGVVGGTILYAASARGKLTRSGNELTGSLPVYCQTAPPTILGTTPFAYTYYSTTDTLIDYWGVEWSRK